jgi:predicted RNA-binding protein with PIN domain
MHVERVLRDRDQLLAEEGEVLRLRRERERENAGETLKYGQEEEQLKAIFERTYGKPKERVPQGGRKIIDSRKSARPEEYSYDSGEKEQSESSSDSKKKYQSEGKRAAAAPKEEYLLVDGYNIIFAWDELKELAEVNIDAARGRLMDILCDYQGAKKCRLLVGFDAYKVKGGIGEVQRYHNIEVVYTREAQTADEYIAKTAHTIGKKDYRVTVATSDGLVQLIVWGQGCLLLSARELKLEIEQTRAQIRETYLEKPRHSIQRLGEMMHEQPKE